MNIVIILAAGCGSRLGRSQNKVFLPVAGKPLIVHSLKVFQEHDSIDHIIVVCRQKEISIVKSIVSQCCFSKVCNVISGGQTRQESARIGIQSIKDFGVEPGSIILFHNAANPVVSYEEIKNVIQASTSMGAAAVATPVIDTIRVVENNLIKQSLLRGSLRAMQTPQGMRFDLAEKAHQNAKKYSIEATDDVGLAFALNHPVQILPAHQNNIKVTTEIDLYLVEKIMMESEYQ